MNNIKMLVTPEQSINVQKICFSLGIFWIRNGKKLRTGRNALLIENNILYYSNINFEEHINFKTVAADHFIKTKGFTIKKALKRKQ